MKLTFLKLSLFAFTVSILAGCFNPTQVVTSEIPAAPFIVPPIPEMNPEYQTFTFDSEKGLHLSLENGTRIVVPPASLVDRLGKEVTGEVALAYREFHDGVDILLSGIPMGYDSAGVSHHLETAGMFDLQASQNGQPVYLSDGSQVQVNMASFTKGDDYNFYSLDQENRNWKYEGQRVSEPNYDKVARKALVSSLKRKKQYLLRKGHFVFNYEALLDIEYNDNYDSIAANGSNPTIKKSILSKAEGYGLTCLGFGIRQWVYFNQKRSYPANMMVWKLLGKPIPSWADTAYQKELTHLRGNIYQLDLTRSKGGTYYHSQVQAVMPLASLYKFSPADWKNERKEIFATLQREETRLAVEADIIRSFEVRQFGIYNWDRIAKEGPVIALTADFDFGSFADTTLFNPTIFYLPGTVKTVIKYPSFDWTKFKLPNDPTARMICVLPENKIAVYTPEAFSKIDRPSLEAMNKPSFTFEMVIYPDTHLNL